MCRREGIFLRYSVLLKGVRPLNLVSVSSVLLISCVKEVMNLGASDQDLNKRTLVTSEP